MILMVLKFCRSELEVKLVPVFPVGLESMQRERVGGIFLKDNTRIKLSINIRVW